MIRVDIGEILIKQKVKGFLSDKQKVFKLVPSFENVSKIGDAEQIIGVYSTLLSNKHLQLLKSFRGNITSVITKQIKEHIKQQNNVASLVITCCCDEDVSKLKLSSDTKINIAVALLRYGISGNAKIRVSQRNESKQYKPQFDINQYISNARVHLGLSLDEAKKLTMTEYIVLMSNKYPDNDGFTAKEYDSVMSDYEKRRAERLAKAAKGE